MAAEGSTAGYQAEALPPAAKVDLASVKFSICNIYDLQGGVMPAGSSSGPMGETARISGLELRRPFLDEGDLSTHDYYNFVMNDEVQFVRVTHSGETVVVFDSVQFVAFTDEVLFFHGKSSTHTMQYGNLIKGKKIPGTNAAGYWAMKGEAEKVERENFKQWLEKVKPTHQQAVQWLVSNSSFSEGDVALFKMIKIHDPIPAGARLATGEEVQANMEKIIPLICLPRGRSVRGAKLADGLKTQPKYSRTGGLEVEKYDPSEDLEFQLVVFEAEQPAAS